MARSVVSMRWRVAIVAALVVAPIVGGAASASAEGGPPTISNASVTPTSLPYSGGDVSVSADVTDEFAVAEVTATIRSLSSGAWTESALSLSGGGDNWSGTIELPATTTTDPETWRISLRADNLDNEETSVDVGDVVVTGQPPFDEPPTVGSPTLSARTLSADGGAVTLAVHASDPRGIFEAYADVTAGKTTHRVTLAAADGDRFEGTFTAPKNRSTSPVRYSVLMTAMNTYGYTAQVDAGRLTVRARPTGHLRLSTTALHFGRTVLGKQATRTIVIRNLGSSATAPVTAQITTSGRPFSIKGAKASGRKVRLAGGQTATVVVIFRPGSTGAKHGSLKVVRSDHVQGALAVVLSGHGVRKS